MEALRRELADLRDELRRRLAPGAETLSSEDAGVLLGRVLRAVEDLGPQAEGTRGQAWGVLIGRAGRDLEVATGTTDPNLLRTALSHAEELLSLAIADMNTPQ